MNSNPIHVSIEKAKFSKVRLDTDADPNGYCITAEVHLDGLDVETLYKFLDCLKHSPLTLRLESLQFGGLR